MDEYRRSPIPPAEHLTWTKPKGLENLHVLRHVATGDGVAMWYGGDAPTRLASDRPYP
ncbi:MAG: hypothetical protein AAFW00_04670 [Bacteroidota bacterium]